MTITTLKILLNVNFTIMKHFWVVIIVDKATEKANLPHNTCCGLPSSTLTPAVVASEMACI